MAKASARLFKLIQSLTKAEKRYFKLYVNRKGVPDNNYIELFDAIARQVQQSSGCDEQALANVIPGPLKVAKHRLYQAILDSLQVLHGGRTVDSRLNNYLTQIEVLYNKGLYADCHQLLKKALHFAEDHERHEYILLLSRWSKYALRNYLPPVVYHEKVAELYQQELQVMEVLRKERAGWVKALKIVMRVMDFGIARSTGQIKKYEALLKEFNKRQQAAICDTFEAKYSYLIAYGYYYYAINDYSNARKNLEQLVALMQTYPEQIRTHPVLYRTSLHNLLTTQNIIRDYTGFSFTLYTVKKFVQSPPFPLSPYHRMLFQLTAIHFEILLYIETGLFRRALRLMPEANRFLKEYDALLPYGLKHALYINIAQVYYGTHHFKQALKQVNMLLQQKQSNIRKDTLLFVKILNIILHFELKHNDVLPYMIRSTIRFLLKQDKNIKFERILLDFMCHHLPRKRGQKPLIASFKTLRSKLLALTKDPFEKLAMDDFDYISWLDSKIEGRSFARIVREKAKKQYTIPASLS